MTQSRAWALAVRENDAYRAMTGNVSSKDPLVAFLYILMRDHLPSGQVQTLVSKALGPPGAMSCEQFSFTDGNLANSAGILAAMLRSE